MSNWDEFQAKSAVEQINAVIAAAEEVVAEAGNNYIYQKHGDAGACFYMYENKADCIVGRIFYKLGMSLEQLKELNGTGQASEAIDHLQYNVLAKYQISSYAVDLLRQGQDAQDGYMNWGIVLKRMQTHAVYMIRTLN